MAKTHSFRKNYGGGVTGSFELKYNDSIRTKVEKAVSKKIDSINRAAPEIFRKAIFDTLNAHPATRHLAPLAMTLKAEKRLLGKPHAGSGLTMSLKDNELNVAINLTERAFDDKSQYYSLMVAQYGRKELPVKEYGVYVLAVDNDFDTTTGLPLVEHDTKEGKYAKFTKGPIAAVEPYHKWIDQSIKLATDRFKRYVRKEL